MCKGQCMSRKRRTRRAQQLRRDPPCAMSTATPHAPARHGAPARRTPLRCRTRVRRSTLPACTVVEVGAFLFFSSSPRAMQTRNCSHFCSSSVTFSLPPHSTYRRADACHGGCSRLQPGDAAALQG